MFQPFTFIQKSNYHLLLKLLLMFFFSVAWKLHLSWWAVKLSDFLSSKSLLLPEIVMWQVCSHRNSLYPKSMQILTTICKTHFVLEILCMHCRSVSCNSCNVLFYLVWKSHAASYFYGMLRLVIFST